MNNVRTTVCPKCKIALQDGMVIVNQDKLERELEGVRSEYNHINNNMTKVKKCLKCPECGFTDV